MNEHGFVRKVHQKLKADKRLRKIWKINDNFQGGVPDAYYLAEAGDLWVEYKYIPRLPKRGTTLIVPDLSELQYGWLRDEQECGNMAWVAVGHPGGVWVTADLDRCREGIATSTFVEETIGVPTFIDRILYVCTGVGA